MMRLLLLVGLGLGLAACRGDNPSADAPSGIPNTPDSGQQTAHGGYDCTPNEAEDEWICAQVDERNAE